MINSGDYNCQQYKTKYLMQSLTSLTKHLKITTVHSIKLLTYLSEFVFTENIRIIKKTNKTSKKFPLERLSMP